MRVGGLLLIAATTGSLLVSAALGAPAPPTGAIVFASAPGSAIAAPSEIAYTSVVGGPVVDLTHAGRRGMVAAEPRWSPDGSRIVFVMAPRRYLNAYAGDGNIYVMSANGTDLHKLTRGLDASAPAWSPDGSRIVFIEGQGQALVVMHADGSHRHVVAQARGYYESPAWSPDGRLIAYESGSDWHSKAIFTIRANGSGERRLTRRSDSIGDPAWSPDGSRIAYSSGNRIWIMTASGASARPVTTCRPASCVFDFAPGWSPSGRELVFVRQEDGGAARHLYVLKLATHRLRPLAPAVRWAGSPDWRP